MTVAPAVESTASPLMTMATVLILILALPLMTVAPAEYERTRLKSIGVAIDQLLVVGSATTNDGASAT